MTKKIDKEKYKDKDNDKYKDILRTSPKSNPTDLLPQTFDQSDEET